MSFNEQKLIQDLLANEDLKVNWDLVLSQAKAESWQISGQIIEKIFVELSPRYSAWEVKTIICFFGLNPERQIELLPDLNEQILFDFSDGDLRTNKALLVLANQYMDIINSFSLRMIVLDLEEQLIILESAMCDIWSWIDRQDWQDNKLWKKNGLLKPEWQFVRNLSVFITQYINLGKNVNKSCLEQIIKKCLHP